MNGGASADRGQGAYGLEAVHYRKLNRAIYVVPALVLIGYGIWQMRIGLVAGLFIAVFVFQCIGAIADSLTSVTFTAEGELRFRGPFQRVTLYPEDINGIQYKAVMALGTGRTTLRFATFRLTNSRSSEVLISRYGWPRGRSLFRDLEQWLVGVDRERFSPDALQKIKAASGSAVRDIPS